MKSKATKKRPKKYSVVKSIFYFILSIVVVFAVNKALPHIDNYVSEQFQNVNKNVEKVDIVNTNVNTPTVVVPEPSEDEKEIQEIKKRGEFKQKQKEIEDLRAENIYYSEKKQALEEELQNTELKLEDLRAKEIELGF